MSLRHVCWRLVSFESLIRACLYFSAYLHRHGSFTWLQRRWKWGGQPLSWYQLGTEIPMHLTSMRPRYSGSGGQAAGNIASSGSHPEELRYEMRVIWRGHAASSQGLCCLPANSTVLFSSIAGGFCLWARSDFLKKILEELFFCSFLLLPTFLTVVSNSLRETLSRHE